MRRGSYDSYVVGAIDYRKQHGAADALSPGGSVIPVHPDVTFKRLPFYDIMGELLKPTSLGMSHSSRVCKMHFLDETLLSETILLVFPREGSNYNAPISIFP